MNAEEYLKGLNEHDPVFEIDTDYEYTEQQLINFAERYHEKQLKLLRIGVVSDSLNIKDSDIATIEALHDLLLDGERYPLNHPTLKRGRELTAKLYKILGYNSN